MSSNHQAKAVADLTKEDVEALPPIVRGYLIGYLQKYGGNPRIPDESNPYPDGSRQAQEWNDGRNSAGYDSLG
jgi:hypothetical protein